MNLTSSRQRLSRRYWRPILPFVLLGVLLGIVSYYAHAQETTAEGGHAENSDTVPVALLPVASELTLTPEQAIAQQTTDKLPEAAQTNAANAQPTAPPTQPPKPWSGYAAAESLAVNGDPEGALQQLDARLTVAPEDAKAAYIKGMILMQLGRVEDAERWFKMMQSNFPDLPQSYNALAVIYAAKEDLYSAETTLRSLLDKHPTHQKARLNLANIYLDLAEIELKNALKEAPNDAMISNTLQSLQRLRD